MIFALYNIVLIFVGVTTCYQYIIIIYATNLKNVYVGVGLDYIV